MCSKWSFFELPFLSLLFSLFSSNNIRSIEQFSSLSSLLTQILRVGNKTLVGIIALDPYTNDKGVSPMMDLGVVRIAHNTLESSFKCFFNMLIRILFDDLA